MASTYRNRAEAVARARTLTRWPVAMCLNWVWTVLCVPATGKGRRYGMPDADVAWQRATQRYSDKTPPAGVPVYWEIGAHGHIALSVGGGRVRTTDWPVKGQIGECGIDELSKRWGAKYRGWSADFAGDIIIAPAPVAASYSLPLKRGSRGTPVRNLQVEMLRVFPAYAGVIKRNGGPNGIYGPATQAVVREFQRRVKINDTGEVDAGTLSALRRNGVKM